jgi:hypothetical protein
MSDYNNPLEYSTGRYGLVDAFYRCIWLPMHHENSAHQIRQVFWSKVPTLVFDLAQFDNWSETTVDSDVSLNWQLPVTDLLSPITNLRLSNPVYSTTQLTYTSKLLINQPSNTILDSSCCVDLQKQMLLYKEVYKATGYGDTNANCDELIDSINQAFQSELSVDQIKDALYDVCISELKAHTMIVGKILNLLDRLYE